MSALIPRINTARRIAAWAVPTAWGAARMAFEGARNAYRARKAWKKYATPMRPGDSVPAPIGYPINNRAFGYARTNKKYPLTKVNNSLVPYKNTSLSIFQGGSKGSKGSKKMVFGRYRRRGNSIYKRRLMISSAKRAGYQTLTRSSFQPVPITGAATLIKGSGDFALNRCPEYSPMAGLFQEYKIKYVTVKFTFDRIGVSSNYDSADYQGMLPFTYVTDTNDATVHVSQTFQDILNHGGAKTGMAFNGESYTLVIKPKFKTPVTGSGGGSEHFKPQTGWLMTNVTDTPHYGYKYAIDLSQIAPISAHIGHMYIHTTYHIQFRKRH